MVALRRIALLSALLGALPAFGQSGLRVPERGEPGPDPAFPRAVVTEGQHRLYYEQYVAGTLDIHEYLGFALRPLAEHAAPELERWHAEFMRLRVTPMITPAARALVRRHLEAGDLCGI